MNKKSKAIIRDRILINLVPFCLAVLSFFIVKRNILPSVLMSPNDGFDVIEMMLSLWGTLLGFMITAVSILLAFNDGHIIKMLKDTGHYGTVLMCYISSCIHLLVAVIIACVCVLGRLWDVYIFAILCSVAIDTALMVVLCLVFLFIIIIRQN